MKRRVVSIVLTVCLAAAAVGGTVWWTRVASAHCQIPCGIYDDNARFLTLHEHIATIEKSMNQINELASDPSGNANQLARWVMNKEDHADYVQEIITLYFLQQRIKPVAEDARAEWDAYTKKLVLCHQILVASMKAKQTTDLQFVEQLRTLVDEFHHAYAGEHSHEGTRH